MAKIPYHKIEKFSGKREIQVRGVPVIKRCNYVIVQGVSVTGDAPKVIVRVYNRREGRHYFKRNKRRWSIYIAKTGHKWYPIESLTEYLLNLLGNDFGLNMAESSVAMIGGQLRFLSKYFLSSHGMSWCMERIFSPVFWETENWWSRSKNKPCLVTCSLCNSWKKPLNICSLSKKTK